jgi:hypothetical protein
MAHTPIEAKLRTGQAEGLSNGVNSLFRNSTVSLLYITDPVTNKSHIQKYFLQGLNWLDVER